MNRFGIGFDLHAFPYGVIAGSDKPAATAIKELYRTQPAHAGRFQGFVMAKGRNFNPVFLGDLKNILAFFALNCFTIEFECDHKSYPL